MPSDAGTPPPATATDQDQAVNNEPQDQRQLQQQCQNPRRQQQQQQQPSSQGASTSIAIDLTSSSQPSSQTPQTRATLKRKFTNLMDDLVDQAKHNDGKRIQRSVSNAEDDDDRFGKKLAVELTCAICSDIFVNPVTCLDCLHVFCGNCIQAWVEESGNSTCPSCRKKIRSTRDSFHLKPIIELLFQNSSLKPDDYDENLTAGPYKPGQPIKIPESYDESEEEEDEEDEEEEDAAEPPYAWPPCPCCPPNNHPEYICPNPLQLNADGNPVRSWNVTNSGHKLCAWCEKPLPYDDNNDVLKKTKCVSCSKIFCGNLFGNCSAANETEIVKIGDSTLYDTNHRSGYRSLGMAVNPFEEDRFDTWISNADNNMTMETLGTKMRDWLFDKNDNQLPIGWTVGGRDDYACKNCLNVVFDTNLLRYLVDQHEEIGYQDRRPKCWYGYNCRTQKHNNRHCENLAHLCDELPPNQRRNTAPARSPPPITTGSARNVPRAAPAPRLSRSPTRSASPPGSPRQASGADDGDGRQSPH